MFPPPRSVVQHLARAALLAVCLSLPGRAAAQPGEEGRPFCLFGRPLPSCRTMLIAQATYYPVAAGASGLGEPLEVEVGVLRNRAGGDAVGMTLALGGDPNGARGALKGRYRRWIGRSVALDVAAGLAAGARESADYVGEPAFGVTGDAALGLTDWISLGVRGDVLWSGADHAPAAAGYGTVRLGTVPGTVATILFLLIYPGLSRAG